MPALDLHDLLRQNLPRRIANADRTQSEVTTRTLLEQRRVDVIERQRVVAELIDVEHEHESRLRDYCVCAESTRAGNS